MGFRFWVGRTHTNTNRNTHVHRYTEIRPQTCAHTHTYMHFCACVCVWNTNTHTHTCTRTWTKMLFSWAEVWFSVCIRVRFRFVLHQQTAAHCNTLQYTAPRYITLQQNATRCNTLQHTATHCNTWELVRNEGVHVYAQQNNSVKKKYGGVTNPTLAWRIYSKASMYILSTK